MLVNDGYYIPHFVIDLAVFLVVWEVEEVHRSFVLRLVLGAKMMLMPGRTPEKHWIERELIDLNISYSHSRAIVDLGRITEIPVLLRCAL